MAKKILVVDDDKLVGITLERLLKLKGYSVSFVDNGTAAIQKVKEADFNLIIADIKMSKLDGIDTIERIRKYLKEQSRNSIPEFLITGYAENESYQRAKALKVTDILYKPFDNDKFLQTVEGILTRSIIPFEEKVESYGEVALLSVEKFFGFTFPECIKGICKNNYVFEKFNQEQIMKVIDFTPPFLKIEKMVVLGLDKNDILQKRSLATGVLTTNDTKGHYSNAIHLAQCGQLMASAASIYLAILFPSTAPQVVEVGQIRLSQDGILWKPSTPTGNYFFIETHIIKKKLQLVVVDAKVFFSGLVICEIDRLKLVLSPKESIWKAKELPVENKDFFKKINTEEIERFFGVTTPEHIKKNYENQQISKRLNQQEIMEIVGFTPPFLKIDKIIIFNADKNRIDQTFGLGMGVITPKDTSGHYNETIFIAICGWLMASAVSIHLAVLFPSTAPEVIEAKGVKPIEKEIWKPPSKGTNFWVETRVIEKRGQSVMMKTRISFDKIPYGVADESKSILIQK